MSYFRFKYYVEITTSAKSSQKREKRYSSKGIQTNFQSDCMSKF